MFTTKTWFLLLQNTNKWVMRKWLRKSRNHFHMIATRCLILFSCKISNWTKYMIICAICHLNNLCHPWTKYNSQTNVQINIWKHMLTWNVVIHWHRMSCKVIVFVVECFETLLILDYILLVTCIWIPTNYNSMDWYWME